MSAKKYTELEKRAQQLAARWSRADNTVRRQSIDYVPAKKKSKPVGYKMQNTFENNLKGVPGASRHGGASIVKMIAAPRTGTVTRKEQIGVLRSARNANTTSGSYNTTVVTEPHEVAGQAIVSDRQGRKVFGR